MLAVILISSASSAETSPRGELEDFFGRVTTVAERGALVRTEVQARYGNDMQLDYLMARSGKGWLVRDVVIDGVSLVENYRAQFARILRTASYADLVLRLRTVAGAGTTGQIAAPPSFEVIVAYFDTSRAELSPAARRDLDRAATWLATNGHARVLVEGYSDQRGDARPNEALAERRAHSIRDYLVAQGVDGDRITTVAYAGQRPVCQDSLETCWAQDRRAVVRMTR